MGDESLQTVDAESHVADCVGAGTCVESDTEPLTTGTDECDSSSPGQAITVERVSIGDLSPGNMAVGPTTASGWAPPSGASW